jgi:hypothetical protein
MAAARSVQKENNRLKQLFVPVIWKEQVCSILWERLLAAIVLTRGWKAAPTGLIQIWHIVAQKSRFFSIKTII